MSEVNYSWNIVNLAPPPDTNRFVIGIFYHSPLMKASTQQEYEFKVVWYSPEKKRWLTGAEPTQWCEIPYCEDVTAKHTILKPVFPRIKI